jgi:hypothetical protein
MLHRSSFAAAFAVAAAVAFPAHADSVAVAGDGAWHTFAVDSLLAPLANSLAWIGDGGNLLDFTFTIGAGLTGVFTVLDAGFAGDAFSLMNFAAPLGATSAVPVGIYPTAHDVGTDFDAAFADAAFSRSVLNLGPGSYRISGALTQSVLLDGAPLDATVGGVRLAIAAPIPEPSSLALLLAGLGAVGVIARRRARPL